MRDIGRIRRISLMALGALIFLVSLGTATTHGPLLRIEREEVVLEVGMGGGLTGDRHIIYLALFQRSTHRYFYLSWVLDNQWEREDITEIVQGLQEYLKSPRGLSQIYPDSRFYNPYESVILGLGESILIRFTDTEDKCYVEIKLPFYEATRLLKVLLNVLSSF